MEREIAINLDNIQIYKYKTYLSVHVLRKRDCLKKKKRQENPITPISRLINFSSSSKRERNQQNEIEMEATLNIDETVTKIEVASSSSYLPRETTSSSSIVHRF